MAENIVTWNATNWLTIVLMAGIGFLVLGFGTKLLRGSANAAAA